MICPECKKEMTWQEGLLPFEGGSRDMTKGKYSCMHCLIFVNAKESRATVKGRALAHGLVGVSAMSKRITSQSCAEQIGLLRERQHCTTCHNDMGEPCTCTDCDCLYCREYK